MNFYTDRQTIDDLNIFGKRSQQSVYSIFNRTYTRGGAELLEAMFRHPLGDLTAINNRIENIRLFGQLKADFIRKHLLFEAVELYMAIRDARSKLNHTDQGLSKLVRNAMSATTDLNLIKKGIHALTELLQELKKFCANCSEQVPAHHPWQAELSSINKIIQLPELQPVFTVNCKKISFEWQVQLDQLFRFSWRNEIQQLLH